MSIDIERLKIDPAYWGEVAPEGATHWHKDEFVRWTGHCIFGTWDIDAWRGGNWELAYWGWKGTLETFLTDGAIPRPTSKAVAASQPKQLTQAVFDGRPPMYIYAAIDESGECWGFTGRPVVYDDKFYFDDDADSALFESGHDTTDWKNSLIERETGIPVSEQNQAVERSTEAARQVEATLAERQNQYGDFSKVAGVSQHLQSVIAAAGADFDDVQREAMQMICSKLARLACGDADHVGSWHDIAGYATLVVKDLEGGK